MKKWPGFAARKRETVYFHYFFGGVFVPECTRRNSCYVYTRADGSEFVHIHESVIKRDWYGRPIVECRFGD